MFKIPLTSIDIGSSCLSQPDLISAWFLRFHNMPSIQSAQFLERRRLQGFRAAAPVACPNGADYDAHSLLALAEDSATVVLPLRISVICR